MKRLQLFALGAELALGVLQKRANESGGSAVHQHFKLQRDISFDRRRHETGAQEPYDRNESSLDLTALFARRPVHRTDLLPSAR